VVAASGAVLREVGSANKTRPADFAAAIGDKTAVLLRIHDVQMPFAAAETTLADLASLARKHQVPLVFDLGPGGLIDLAKYGIEHQPLAAGAIAAGADVVLLRGDKLLGGPRCGVLAGRAAAIGTIRRHGLFSAMQAGPLTLAALGETLRLYGDSELAERSIPLLSLLATPVENLRNRAERVAPQIAASGVATASVIDSQARLFGGPGIGPVFPSVGIALTPARGSAAALAASLSSRSPALVGRLEADRWVLDLRGVLPRQDIELVSAFEALAPPKEDEPPPLPDPIA
jgi:L-seryl-tRNA(Ser) seleniumtransferase